MTTPPGDRECIELCLNGDAEAYRPLVERYRPMLWSYVNGMVRNADRTEEVVQEAFVRAYFLLSKLQKPEVFHSWLFGIAHNVVREMRRSQRRMRQPAEDRPIEPVQMPVEVDDDLQLAVSRLPEVYRDTIQLRFYRGLSCAETAERLGVSLGTVTKNLSRAYAMLRATVKRDQD